MPTSDKSYTEGFAKEGTKVKFCDTWTTQYLPYLLNDTDVRNLSKDGRFDQMSISKNNTRFSWEQFVNNFFGLPGLPNYSNWASHVEGTTLENPYLEQLPSPYSVKAGQMIKLFFLNGIDLFRYQYGFYHVDGNRIQEQSVLNESTWLNKDTNFSSPMGQSQPLPNDFEYTPQDDWKICDAKGISPYGGFHYLGRIDPTQDPSNADLVEFFEDPAWNGATRLERFVISINDDDFTSDAGPYLQSKDFMKNGVETQIGGHHIPWYYSQMQFTAYTDFFNLSFSTLAGDEGDSVGATSTDEIFTPVKTLAGASGIAGAGSLSLLAKRLDFRKAASSFWFNNIIMCPPFISSYNGMSDTGWDWTVPSAQYEDQLSSYRFFIEEVNLATAEGPDGADYAVAPIQLMDFMNQPEPLGFDPITGNFWGDPTSPGIGFNEDTGVKDLFIDDPNNPFFDAIDLLRRHGSMTGGSLIQSPAYAYVSPQKLFFNGGLYKGVFAGEGKGWIEYKQFSDEVGQLHVVDSTPFLSQQNLNQYAPVLIPADVLSNPNNQSAFNIGENPMYAVKQDELLYNGNQDGTNQEFATVPSKYLQKIKQAVKGFTGQDETISLVKESPAVYNPEHLERSDIDLTKNPPMLGFGNKDVPSTTNGIWRYNDHHFEYHWPIYLRKESENLSTPKPIDVSDIDTFSGIDWDTILDGAPSGAGTTAAEQLTSNSIKWNHSSVYSYFYEEWEDFTAYAWGQSHKDAPLHNGLAFELYLPNFHTLLEEMRTLLPDFKDGSDKTYANKDAWHHTTLGGRLKDDVLRPTLTIIPGAVFVPSLANVGATTPSESNIPNEFESIWGYNSPGSIAMGELVSPPKVEGKLPYFSNWIEAFKNDHQNVLNDVSKVAEDFQHVVLMPNVMKRHEDINFSKHVMPAYVEFNFENLHPPESSLLSGEDEAQQSTTITTDHGYQFDINDPTMADILNYTGFMPLVIGFYKHLKNLPSLFGNKDDYRCQIGQNASHYKFDFPFTTYYEQNGSDTGFKCQQITNYQTIYNLDNFFKFWTDPTSWNPVVGAQGNMDVDPSGVGEYNELQNMWMMGAFDPYSEDLNFVQKFHYLWELKNSAYQGTQEYTHQGLDNAIAYLTDIFKMQIVDTRPEEEWNAISLWRELQEMHGNFLGIPSGYTGEGQASNPATKGSILSLLIQNFVEEKLRTFKQMIQGDPAHSETLFIEIRKFKESKPGLNDKQLIQTFYIPMSSELQKLKFVDSQVVFGVNYTYEISEVKYVMGSLYQYGSRIRQGIVKQGEMGLDGKITQQGSGETWNGVGEESDITFKSVVKNNPGLWSDKKGEPWSTTESAYLTVNVRSQATHKMIPIKYATAKAQVRELPPTPPQVDIIPYRTCINCVYISFNPTADNYLAFPIALTKNEANADYTWQHYVGAVPGEEGNKLYPTDTPGEDKDPTIDPTPPHMLCRFKSEGDIHTYESYRISEEDRPYGPLSWFDFGNPAISKKTTISVFERTTFVDELKPNVNYYYTFRAVDRPRKIAEIQSALGYGAGAAADAPGDALSQTLRQTRNWSNPTDVYRVRLVKNFDSVYLDMEVKPLHYWIWQAKIKDKIPSKTFRKYLMIKPSLNQAILNTELLYNWLPDEQNPYAGVNYWSNEIFPSIYGWIYNIENGEATKIKLGNPLERVISVFGSNANLNYSESATYYKAKITSRKTGREINILFGCPAPTLHDKTKAPKGLDLLGPEDGVYEPCGDKAK